MWTSYLWWVQKRDAWWTPLAWFKPRAHLASLFLLYLVLAKHFVWIQPSRFATCAQCIVMWIPFFYLTLRLSENSFLISLDGAFELCLLMERWCLVSVSAFSALCNFPANETSQNEDGIWEAFSHEVCLVGFLKGWEVTDCCKEGCMMKDRTFTWSCSQLKLNSCKHENFTHPLKNILKANFLPLEWEMIWKKCIYFLCTGMRYEFALRYTKNKLWKFPDWPQNK